MRNLNKIKSVLVVWLALILSQTTHAFRFELTNYDTFESTLDVELADLDNDSDLDLIATDNDTVDFQSTKSVSILFNDGNGNFLDQVQYEVLPWPESVEAEYINDDEYLDLISGTGHTDGHDVSILFNNGDGTFASQQTYNANPNNESSHVIAADLDAVNGLDIVAASNAINVTVLLNQGDGVYDDTEKISFQARLSPLTLAVADLDGVNGNDILAASGESDILDAFINDGTGTGFARTSTAALSFPGFVAAADFDGVNGPDAVVSNLNTRTISVFLNRGLFPGTNFWYGFNSYVNYRACARVKEIAVPDMNRDGWPDIVVACMDADRVAILLNKGNGTFARAQYFNVAYSPTGLAIGDIDNDRWLDIVTGNLAKPDWSLPCPDVCPDNVSVLLNTSGKPDAFTFTDISNADLFTEQVSNAITVSNLVYDTDIWIEGGEYSVNGGPYTDTDGMVSNGDVITVRHSSSDQYATVTDTTLFIGGVNDTFTSETILDRQPDPFSFTDLTQVELSTVLESETIAIIGLGAEAPVTITGGEFRINGGGYSAGPTQINQGDTIQIRGTSSGSYGITTDVQLTIGGVSDVFSMTTKLSTTPDVFSFDSINDAPVSTLQESNSVLISGLGSVATVSVLDGEISVNGGAFTSTDLSINNGDQLQVRHTSASDYLSAVTSQITIGEFSTTFSSTTGHDLIPDTFTFEPQAEVPLDTLIVSEPVFITGLTSTIPISVKNGDYRIDGGEFINTAGLVGEGSVIQLRLLSSADYSALSKMSVDIGGVKADFKVTTLSEPDEPEKEDPGGQGEQEPSGGGHKGRIDDHAVEKQWALFATAVGISEASNGKISYLLVVLLAFSLFRFSGHRFGRRKVN